MEDRQTKFAAQVMEMVAAYVQKEANTDPLITITYAEVAKDYKNATVYFTTIPDNRQHDAELFLKRVGKDIRHYLMKHMRVKVVPFLTFSVDYGERHRQHIDELVRETGTESTPVTVIKKD